jgi:L-threonylcarbamoyladenylate synthase
MIFLSYGDYLIELLNKKFWPGALTIIVKKSPKTPDYITLGKDTVGIRISNHPVFFELLRKGVESHILATTSANISGEGFFSRKVDVINLLAQI